MNIWFQTYLIGCAVWLTAWGYFRKDMHDNDDVLVFWGAFIWPAVTPAIAGVLLRKLRDRRRAAKE